MRTLLHRAIRQYPPFIAIGVLLSACASPNSPSTFILGGVIRDDASLPVRDAIVEVTSGSLTGTVTMSDVSGRFVFREPADASAPTTLLITKFGYASRSVQVERLSDIVVTLSAVAVSVRR